MFTPHPFGIRYVTHFFYIKRINDNSYQYQKCFGATHEATSSIETMDKTCDPIWTKTLAEIQEIHPDLVCNKDGEERVLIECCYRPLSYKSKKQLGFFLLEPKTMRSPADGSYNFFSYSLVITPKPGIFPGVNE